jgi:hypothetical protein
MAIEVKHTAVRSTKTKAECSCGATWKREGSAYLALHIEHHKAATDIKYMECRGCGEVFEQCTAGKDAARVHAQDCPGGFRRNLAEDEAF